MREPYEAKVIAMSLALNSFNRLYIASPIEFNTVEESPSTSLVAQISSA